MIPMVWSSLYKKISPAFFNHIIAFPLSRSHSIQGGKTLQTNTLLLTRVVNNTGARKRNRHDLFQVLFYMYQAQTHVQLLLIFTQWRPSLWQFRKTGPEGKEGEGCPGGSAPTAVSTIFHTIRFSTFGLSMWTWTPQHSVQEQQQQ